jgi:hypothetical protein
MDCPVQAAPPVSGTTNPIFRDFSFCQPIDRPMRVVRVKAPMVIDADLLKDCLFKAAPFESVVEVIDSYLEFHLA